MSHNRPKKEKIMEESDFDILYSLKIEAPDYQLRERIVPDGWFNVQEPVKAAFEEQIEFTAKLTEMIMKLDEKFSKLGEMI